MADDLPGAASIAPSLPLTVVCARADHPEGYGFGGKAHGYVTLLVTGVVKDDLPLLVERLRRPVVEPFQQGGSTSWWGTWYGGRFDPVAVVAGPLTGLSPMVPGLSMLAGKVVSVGDNRAALAIPYADLMRADEPAKASGLIQSNPNASRLRATVATDEQATASPP